MIYSYLPSVMILILFLMSLTSFVSNWNHILSTLMALEFTILSLFLTLTSMNNFLTSEIYTNLIFLALAVCEGAMALSILVLYARSHGNDQLKSPVLLQW